MNGIGEQFVPVPAMSEPTDADREQQYVLIGEWLALDTGRHNCGVGPDGHYGAHEPSCGLEPVERVQVLLDALAPALVKRDATAREEGRQEMRAAMEALADRGELLNDDSGHTVRAVSIGSLRAAVAPAQPADGFCVCESGRPMRDCGIAAHRRAAQPADGER